MAYIEGLKESEQALNEIQKLIKEIAEVNHFLEVQNPTMLFKLSFSVNNPDYREEPNSDGVEVKKSKKQKKMIQYSTPLLCDDIESLYYFIRLYKERKVRTVNQLADVHRIHLTEEEKAILDI